ncbi:putative sodium-dependent multivitamin transporter [Nephila pilipes]|uniref:Putative sodium-dependent multivitamin transporter n=1 Tax=Nephila pilipes TaxID=299642 RepID=A0A8X6NNX1_NEPPI|nr:putative sodium-dependent multivitamin transporter [Nephila pilipes]
MNLSQGSFTAVDYVIFALLLILSSSVGVYYLFSERKKSYREYFLTNRSMPIAPIAFSLMASFMSAITILGVAAESYFYGTQYAMISLGYAIATPISTYVFLPVFYNMQITSIFEFLEKRFNKEVRLVASLVFILQMIIYMAIVLYAPAIALSAVMGLSKWTSVLLIGSVCTFYSTIGGMRAVLWTDLFQALFMFFAVFAIIIKGTVDVGGLSEVWRIATEGERIELFNFDPDPTVRHTFWTVVVGGMFTCFSANGINQAQVQRLLTSRSLKESRLLAYINLIFSYSL